jgi:DNA-binding MarR family transcriptional regulator
MESKDLNDDAKELRDMTFDLFNNCQEKEYKIAGMYGLSQAEFRCLRYFGVGEKINNKKIACRMKLSPGRLTRIIDGLVIKGLLIRELNSADRRNMNVSLSPNGVQLIGQINESYLKINKEILGGLSDIKRKETLNALKILIDSMNNWLSKV